MSDSEDSSELAKQNEGIIAEKLFGDLSRVSGSDFFDRALVFILETLDMDYGFVGTLLADGNTVRIELLRGPDGIISNFEYCLDKTPCQNVFNQRQCIHFDDVQSAFPEDEILIEMSIQGYIGTPLFSRSGRPMGILVLLSKREISDAEKANRLLELFGNRVALEMERSQYETELREAKEKAEEADRLKSAFLANLSHEVRTPLNGILGFAQMLGDGALDDDDRREYARIVQSCGKHLLRIIQDLIDVAQIESGQLKLEKKRFDLFELYREMDTIFKADIANSGKPNLRLQWNGAQIGELMVLGDEDRIRQIFENLIGNAIKYSDEGVITIETLPMDNDRFAFSVSDQGRGIHKEDLGRIFERFEQVDDGPTREFEGVGLGLAISKGLVELMDGTLSAESVMGEGSVFRFEIALKRDDPLEADALTAGENATNASSRRLRALVVEDNDTNYLLLKAMIGSQASDLTRAQDGEEAIKIVRDGGDFDMILMVIRMPGVNGYEATREIKRLRPNVPIVIQSALVSESDKSKGFEAGCDEFVEKPIVKSKLDEVIQRFVS